MKRKAVPVQLQHCSTVVKDSKTSISQVTFTSKCVRLQDSMSECNSILYTPIIIRSVRTLKLLMSTVMWLLDTPNEISCRISLLDYFTGHPSSTSDNHSSIVPHVHKSHRRTWDVSPCNMKNRFTCYLSSNSQILKGKPKITKCVFQR
jgi:hypothetical protein